MVDEIVWLGEMRKRCFMRNGKRSTMLEITVPKKIWKAYKLNGADSLGKTYRIKLEPVN